MAGRISIFVALSALAAYFIYAWRSAFRRASDQRMAGDPELTATPSLLQLATGFVTNFFDTLGVGSFATTITIFKLGRMVPDELVPGTMNVGHTLPVVLQAFIYISIIQVDLTTMVSLIAASVVGAWLGADIVARLPRRAIQLGVGAALTAAVVFMAMRELGWFPAGGDKLALHPLPLAAGMAGTFVFGALVSLGIGFYAPCMILVSLLGMSPLAAFPIMMGSAAFQMPVASLRFMKSHFYQDRAALGLTLGGLPAVLLAAFIVKSLPLDVVRKLVIVVALWAAFLLFRSAYRERNSAPSPVRPTPP